MTNPETARDLLARAESYLSALHGSVARHDNLAANLGCAGCELRNQIAAELCRAAAVSVPPPAPRADARAAVDLADGPVRCPLCVHTVTLHTPNGARAHFTAVHPEQRVTGRGHGPWPLLVTDGAEAQSAVSGPCVAGEQQNETPEDPARIDRLRPEFTEHSSIEAIDAQLRRSRAQERRWHIRTEWLISLRANRVAQKERGEWPAAGVRQDEAQS